MVVGDNSVRITRRDGKTSVTNLGDDYYVVTALDKDGGPTMEPHRVYPGKTLTLLRNLGYRVEVRDNKGNVIRTARLSDADPFAMKESGTATIHPAVILFTDPPFLIHNGSMLSVFADTRPTKNGTEMSLHTGATTFTIRCPDALNIEVHPDGNVTLRVSKQEKA